MIKYHCDRCDRQVEGIVQLYPVVVACSAVPSGAKKAADLCERCQKELLRFLEPLPLVAAAHG